jgi:anti-sigma-K factor RskA
MALPAAITAKLGDGAGLVLTREPIGGKPEGVDAGPVVAEGSFNRV